MKLRNIMIKVEWDIKEMQLNFPAQLTREKVYFVRLIPVILADLLNICTLPYV